MTGDPLQDCAVAELIEFGARVAAALAKEPMYTPPIESVVQCTCGVWVRLGAIHTCPEAGAVVIDLAMHECGVMVAVGENHVCPDVVLAHERARLDVVGA